LVLWLNTLSKVDLGFRSVTGSALHGSATACLIYEDLH
jgi:hypothetical protein